MTEEEIKMAEAYHQEKMKEKERGGINWWRIGSVAIVLGMGYFVYKAATTPSSDVILNIASRYHSTPIEEIKIVNSFEKEGKIVQILEMERMICEMPMVKIDGNWVATGLSCQG